MPACKEIKTLLQKTRLPTTIDIVRNKEDNRNDSYVSYFDIDSSISDESVVASIEVPDHNTIDTVPCTSRIKILSFTRKSYEAIEKQ